MCTKRNFDKRRHASFKTQLLLRSFSAFMLYLPDVINCQYRQFAAALLGPVYFLLPDQQSGISPPDYLRDPAVDYEQFRRDLKTYLFTGHSKR